MEKAKIWAVDDEESLLSAIGELLMDSGFDFRGFTDPRNVVPALHAGLPDLLLVDLNMPHLTGAELIALIRREFRDHRVPVIVLTALSSESALLNAFKAGADDVVRKPFSFGEMLARIQWQLERVAQLDSLKQQNEDMRMLMRLAQTMSQDDSLPAVLRMLIESMRHTLNVARCSVYLVHEESGELHRALPADPSQAEGSPNMRLDLRGSATITEGLLARRPVYLGTPETQNLMHLMGGEPVRAQTCSSAIFPMQLKGRMVGILVLIAPREDFGKGERESALCKIAADLTGVAVRRSELFQTLRQDHFVIDEANRQLAEARDFLSGVIDSSPDAIVVASIKGEIKVFNRAAERVIGWTRDEALGMNVRNLYPPGGAERIMTLLRSDQYGGVGKLLSQRHMLTDRTGKNLPVEISASIIYGPNGEEMATVGVFKDVRSHLQMVEALQAANEDLDRTRRQIVVAELAGAAAHELNQPLTSLLAYAEMLRRVLLDEEHLRVLSKVDTEARRVAEVVQKIGRITQYKTKAYVGGERIVDLDSASEPIEDGRLGEDYE